MSTSLRIRPVLLGPRGPFFRRLGGDFRAGSASGLTPSPDRSSLAVPRYSSRRCLLGYSCHCKRYGTGPDSHSRQARKLADQGRRTPRRRGLDRGGRRQGGGRRGDRGRAAGGRRGAGNTATLSGVDHGRYFAGQGRRGFHGGSRDAPRGRAGSARLTGGPAKTSADRVPALPLARMSECLVRRCSTGTGGRVGTFLPSRSVISGGPAWARYTTRVGRGRTVGCTCSHARFE
jgi:hypothetical protein